MKDSSRILSALLLLAFLLCAGCTFHGKLKSGFYQPMPGTKLPFTAGLVYGRNLRSQEFIAKDVYVAHGAVIQTDPGLRTAMLDACTALFKSASIAESANEIPVGVDIAVIPTVEFRETALYMSWALRDATTGEPLGEYSASGNVIVSVPAKVHVMGGVNAAFGLVLSPAVAPAITKAIGKEAQANLESRLRSCLDQISEAIRNDRALIAKEGSRHPQEP